MGEGAEPAVKVLREESAVLCPVADKSATAVGACLTISRAIIKSARLQVHLGDDNDRFARIPASMSQSVSALPIAAVHRGCRPHRSRREELRKAGGKETERESDYSGIRERG